MRRPVPPRQQGAPLSGGVGGGGAFAALRRPGNHAAPRPRPCRAARRKSCPFAHPGEHARRRPLDRFAYSAEMCPRARAGEPCPDGDACPFSHHVFEVRATPRPAPRRRRVAPPPLRRAPFGAP
jgi:hypothetical protein